MTDNKTEDTNQVNQYEYPPEDDENTVRRSILLQDLLIVHELAGQLKFVTDRAFDSVDEDRSGGLDSGELHSILVEVSKQMDVNPPTLEDLDEILAQLDENNDGTVDKDEFHSLVMMVISNLLE